ncbi:REP-associated tyrosine transposase [Roseicyclus elongatus]
MGQIPPMPNYRRPSPSTMPVFFTVCLVQQGSTALIDHLDILREAVRLTLRDRPFDILAWVVLPDHMLAVWRLPESDPNYSQRWGRIKSRFTRDLRVRLRRPGLGPESFPTEFPEISKGRFAGLKPGLRTDKREQAVWQRRFWEHHCRDDRDLEAHIRYCWGNPVKHGFVTRPADWPASSIHRDIRLGRVEPEWSGVEPVGAFGEMA